MTHNVWIAAVLTGFLFACAATVVDAGPGSMFASQISSNK